MDKQNKNDIHKSLIYCVVKRGIDILGAALGIIFLSPLMIIIAIAIKMDSKGPVFFAHKRLGQYGNTIKVYKFRSMVQNADEILKNFTEEQKKEFRENFKLKDDPRITKIGDFLRKTSLDELPQLFNILIGNISIVGPRPIVEKELEKYGIYAEKFLSVKPGLTGLWQVSGRSDISYCERIKLDMKYISTRNLWIDLKIIFKTVLVVFSREGAR